MSLDPGQRLGHYEITSRLGSGGMGEVYRARDTRLDRSVAIKLLNDELRADADGRRRFEVEARAISALSHPNICALHDVGGDNGVEYLVMELLDGETLAQRLERGPLAWAQAQQVADQIAAGLDRAHRAGIVHRDLKPANVMLTRHGVKLLDFGLARFDPARRELERWEQASPNSQTATRLVMTAEGLIVGTLHYMAPEQLEGRPVDARADIFAFGAVLYEMVTGRRAFEGSSVVAVGSAILRDDPPPIDPFRTGSAAGLDPLLRGCLTKNPEERWQNIHDVRLALNQLTQPAGLGATASPERRRWPAIVAAALAALAVSSSVAWWLGSGGEPTPPRQVSFFLDPPARHAFADAPEVTSFALSPEGSRLAFAASPPGEPARFLFVRPLAELHAQKVLGTEGASSVFWSPDGQRLGFFADGKLKIVSLTGTDQIITICAVGQGFGFNGTWGEDTILYATAQGARIYRVAPTAGSTPEVLLTADPPTARFVKPWYLPDKRHFLFSAASGNMNWTLRLADQETGTWVEIAQGILRAVPTRDQLVFVRDGQLFTQSFDASRGAFTGTPRMLAPRVRAFAPTAHAAFSASHDGTVVYADQAAEVQLVHYDRFGQVLGRLGEIAESTELALDRLAPRALVARLDPERATYDLWMIDLERGVETRFTNEPGLETMPYFGVDGSILYGRATSKAPLIVVHNPGAAPTPLLSSTGFQIVVGVRPNQGPNNQRSLVYIERGDETGPGGQVAAIRSLFEIGLDPTGPPRRLFDGVGPAADLSPDGRWAAVSRRESKRTEVFLVPLEAGEVVRVSVDGGSFPRFEPDGRGIVFLGPRGELWRAELRPNTAISSSGAPGASFSVGAPTQLFALPPLGWKSFAIASDGSFYALENTVDATTAPLKVLVGGAG